MLRAPVCSLILVLVACSSEPGTDPGDGNDNPPPAPTAAFRVLHAVADIPAIDVLVDDSVVLSDLRGDAVSPYVPVPDGVRAIAFRPVGSAGAVVAHSLTLAAGDSLTVLTIDSGTVLNPWVLTDTGAIVPATRSKLRALHFAGEAPALDIWRTQPDWPDPITFMFPHNYREITPYVESDPGTWTVIVSTRRRNQQGVPVLQDTLLITAPIPVPAGTSRTVIVLDAAGGGLTYQVIDP